jgi:serine protease Do
VRNLTGLLGLVGLAMVAPVAGCGGSGVPTAAVPDDDPLVPSSDIIAKARALGDTPWASIDHVIEYDANIQPGNSGGPLVVADGRVVGVDYAAASFTNQSQSFAIAASDARSIVERLRQGENVDSLGVNSQAIVLATFDLAG